MAEELARPPERRRKRWNSREQGPWPRVRGGGTGRMNKLFQTEWFSVRAWDHDD